MNLDSPHRLWRQLDWRRLLRTWRIWCGLTLLACALALSAAWHWHGQREQWRQESLRAQSIAADARSEPASSSEAADFVRRMTPALASAVLLKNLQNVCAEAGVQMLRFSAAAPLAGGSASQLQQELDRLDYELTLRGSYPAIKQVLKAVVDRHGQLTVHHLRLQRQTAAQTAVAGAGVELEAQIRLSAWGRPLSLAAAFKGTVAPTTLVPVVQD